jgi:hypothetical protein
MKELNNLIKMAKEVTFPIIKKGEEVMPTCLVEEKDGKIGIIGMPFHNPQQKGLAKEALKKLIINMSLKGYVMVFDTKMTLFDQKTGKVEVNDTLMIAGYTPKNKVFLGYPYKDKKFLKKKEIKMEGRESSNMRDDWDIWGEKIDDETAVKYSKFRDENPELYGDEDGS